MYHAHSIGDFQQAQPNIELANNLFPPASFYNGSALVVFPWAIFSFRSSYGILADLSSCQLVNIGGLLRHQRKQLRDGMRVYRPLVIIESDHRLPTFLRYDSTLCDVPETRNQLSGEPTLATIVESSSS